MEKEKQAVMNARLKSYTETHPLQNAWEKCGLRKLPLGGGTWTES